MDEEFRADLTNINRPSQDLKIVEVRHPWRLGWQRAPEFDQPPAEAWERPDGSIVGVITDAQA